MELELFQVDAFTSRLFGGNPAAVVPLDQALPDETLMAIAMENNLSETAFILPGEDEHADFHLRWFTPTAEVDLCGHATLAASAVLFYHKGFAGEVIRFSSQAGPLTVTRNHSRLILDFPQRHITSITVSDQLETALGARPSHAFNGKDVLAVFENQSQVAALKPDFKKVAMIAPLGLCATALGDGDDVDFISRYFAPGVGIDEDPVTGSAHCTLVPYWAQRLQKNKLNAVQISAREGELACEYVPTSGRVRMAGHAVTYLRGTIYL